MKRTWILLPLAAILLAPAIAGADKEKAREHYRQGQTLFNLGKFQEASLQFESAYQFHADPALLFNLGQCHRHLGNKDRALFFYRGFLRKKPDAPNRPEVEKFIEELEGRDAGAAPPAPIPLPMPVPVAPPPAPPPEPVPAPAPAKAVPPPPPAPSRPAESVAPTSAPPKAPESAEAAVEVTAPSGAPPSWQKWASYGVIGAGVVAVGVGVSFGLQANQAEKDLGSADIVSEQLQESYDSRKSRGKMAPLLLGVGSAAIVGGGLWAYFLHGRSPSEPTAQLDLDVSDGLRVGYTRSF